MNAAHASAAKASVPPSRSVVSRTRANSGLETVEETVDLTV
jgi:hypothetical protein